MQRSGELRKWRAVALATALVRLSAPAVAFAAADRTPLTVPFNQDGKEPTRLGYWKFSATNWVGEAGQVPLAYSNIQQVAGFDGNALSVTNPLGILRYRDVEANGRPNIDLRSGSIRLWYKPNWSGTNAGGTGPGGYGVWLLQMGQFVAPGSNTHANDGFFALSIFPAGNVIDLTVQDNQGHTANATGAGTFTKNVWHEIIVSYGPRQIGFWLNGYNVGSTALTSDLPYPPASVRAQGFVVGNRGTGGFAALGSIDELETFNHPLDWVHANHNGRALSVSVADEPSKIQLQWRADPNLPKTVQRRLTGQTNWTRLASNYLAWSFADTNALVGRTYEYNVTPSGLPSVFGSSLLCVAGVDLPPVEYRGKVIVLVDQTMATDLATSLSQLTEDLAGDGWQVITSRVPRHNDANWAANPGNIAAIKALITNIYYADPTNTKAVFLIGHVAIPYSGMEASDGHTENFDSHRGAWPADLYYGDIDGIWTDRLPFPPGRKSNYPENANSAGDGKFDQDYVPTNGVGVAAVELAVGRIDFAKMPVFTRDPPAGVAPVSETDLIRRYLGKDHRFRLAQLKFQPRTIALDEYAPVYRYPEGSLYGNSVRNGSRLFGFDGGRLIEEDAFATRRNAFWALLSDQGQPDGVGNPRHYSRDLTRANNEPAAAVFILSGSWFSDWNLASDNILRACLATPNSGLISLSGLGTAWRFESLALGESFGDGFLHTANEAPASNPTKRWVTILGDPTLRAHYTARPTNLVATTGAQRGIDLHWDGTGDALARYYVYRSASLTNQFTRLTSSPLAETSFTDASPPAGTKVYQVRALTRTVTGSGSYTNLSQGIFKTIN